MTGLAQLMPRYYGEWTMALRDARVYARRTGRRVRVRRVRGLPLGRIALWQISEVDA